VRVEWAASNPLENDGGLLVKHAQVLGSGVAGWVVEVGPGVKNPKIGDKARISNVLYTTYIYKKKHRHSDSHSERKGKATSRIHHRT
jgi:hypothetical protein